MEKISKFSMLKIATIIIFIIASLFVFFISSYAIKFKKEKAMESYVQILRDNDNLAKHLRNGDNLKFERDIPSQYAFAKIKTSQNFILRFAYGSDVYYVNMDNKGDDKRFGLKFGQFEFKITDIFDGKSHSVNFKSIDCGFDDGQSFIYNVGRVCIDKTYKIK